MRQDMCIPCGKGFVNLRVGAIIMKDGKILMVGNEDVDYLYSVGGRIQFGEMAEQAVVREVEEETGARMEIDRLGFVEENYFYADIPTKAGKLIYEIGFYYYMKVPEDFSPVSLSFTEANQREFLRWVDPGCGTKMFPEFFATELCNPDATIRFFSNDAR